MPKFKVKWDGSIFATSIIIAENKEEAIRRAEDGEVDMDSVGNIDDVVVEECNEIV